MPWVRDRRVAGQRAQVAVRRQELGEPADLVRRDRRPAQARIALEQVADDARRLPPARASRCNRRAGRPACTSSTARSSSRRCRPASAAMSASRLSQGMSGWRRMVPVDEQGASSSTASNGSGLPVGDVGRDGLGRECRAGRDSRAAARAGGERSTAVTRRRRRRAARSCRPAPRRDRRPLLPRTSPSSRAGSAAAASCTHQAPSA